MTIPSYALESSCTDEIEEFGGEVRSTTVGIIVAAVGQVMCVAGVLKEFVAAPVPTCNPAEVSIWLIAAALGPLLVLVGVAMYVNGHTKRLNADAESGLG
ncbi:hypothetical protein Q3O98_17265 [Ralstonia pseudosolanacearum]|uniref:hypothetical protein n=1 Tax=Ralstonia pseudosolanacearum TaxID=1310165 RepID=UPI0026746BA2|nr:hypothetical protein [Ralstonia pseudosolanacearum]MDO3622832.1 hypothetical protein [Ralstonia pseudosolanacearum]